MAPTTSQLLLSPAELSYLHSSLSLNPPVRPDGRTPTQFRPLIAESGILPSANGSARICFGDGTEAIVGVKAEVEKSFRRAGIEHVEEASDDNEGEAQGGEKGTGEESWTEISIEVPGFRDDDALPIFLAAMLTEALLADGKLKDRLWINRRFHWKLYIDACLLQLQIKSKKKS
jgi:exosome complex component RRP42